MSGSSHGKSMHSFINARIGTSDKIKMLYTPAHKRADGKMVSARLVIPILVNEYSPNGNSDPNSFRLVAWGALADMFARNLSKGKEMTFFCDGSSYWGNVFYSDGTQVMQKDGTALQTRQTSFTIRGFLWGADSNATIQEEIMAGMKSGEGRRPAQWNVPGSPDNQVWKQLLQRRKQTFYMGGNTFGYATVVAPRGGGEILVGDQSKILRQNANVNTNVNTNAPLVNQVQNTFNQPVQNQLNPIGGIGYNPTTGQPNPPAGNVMSNQGGLPTYPA